MSVDATSAKGLSGLAAAPGLWLPVATLAQRELTRFFRQRTRIVGALGQPILFWVLFGAGLQGAFKGPADMSYQEYFFPGVAAMILMFTAMLAWAIRFGQRRTASVASVWCGNTKSYSMA